MYTETSMGGSGSEPAACGVRRIFFSWDRPLIPQLVERLRAAAGAGWDLSAEWVIAPTRRSARRLRESIAEAASHDRKGVCSPMVSLPESLIQPSDSHRPIATARQLRVVWARALLEAPSEELRSLFPTTPERDAHWAQSAARSLTEARRVFGEAGLRLEDVCASLGKDHPEKVRWRDLAALETVATRILDSIGREDPVAARRLVPSMMQLPSGVKRIWLVGCPDLTPLMLRYLESWALSAPIVVGVYANPDLEQAFDGWGRPLPAHWNETELSWALGRTQVLDCGDPQRQAQRLLRGLSDEEWTAVAPLDPEVLLEMNRGMESFGLAAHDPRGIPLNEYAAWTRLDRWAEFIETGSFQSALEMARDPRLFGALVDSGGSGAGDWYGALKAMDRASATWLPTTVESVRRRGDFSALDAGARRLLDTLSDCREDARAEGAIVAAQRFLERVYRDSFGEEASALVIESLAERLSEVFADLAPFDRGAAALAPGVMARWLVAILSEERLDLEPSPTEVECLGWLETLWEESPNLAVAGFNEGLVPESVQGHLLAPDSLRRALGLRDNGTRAARDAYITEAALRSREGQGTTLWLFGGRTSIGDPLRPSSLLFRLPDEDLARFVSETVCSEEEPSAEPAGARRFPWQFRPPLDHEREFSRVSVTGLRAYLQCPFRFYLGHGLGMRREVELDKLEWNAAEFGDLIHHTMEAFGRDASVRDSRDSREIATYLRGEAARLARQRHGPSLPGAVAVQLEFAQRRLQWMAKEQARIRSEGWRIVDVERSFETRRFSNTLAVSGKIDRIDLCERTGAYRLIDYKTGNKGEGPRDTHWARAPKDENEARELEWTAVGPMAPDLRWIDLQLPLYALVLRDELDPHVPITCGYFLAPMAVTETRLTLWDSLDAEVLGSAEACARAALEAIESRRFWPPVSRPAYDPYESLFGGQPEANFDFERLFPRHPQD